MLKLFKNTNSLHFVGIGGIGMSGMAELLSNHGFVISGSDLNKSPRTKHLEECGIKISYKHNKKNICNSDVIIYSSAIELNNIEITSAIKKNIPVIKRSELLGELIKIKDISIAVSGTHGKTTTSSMVGSILHEANLNPTIIIGGIVNKFNSNNISGSGDIIVVEADEFDKSFLALQPTYSIINNIDLEHLDCYEDLDSLLSTFCQFANSIPFYGKVIINNDSKNVQKICDEINKPKITFSIYKKSDVQAVDISFSKNKSYFKLKNKKSTIKLNCPGMHNIYNALAAIAISQEIKIPFNKIKKGLENYQGVKRRFEISYNNLKNGIMVIDDYAHHPEEIKATILAAKNGWGKRIISVFQPHLFSRTRDFYIDFSKSLSKSDIIIITDVFGSREKKIKGVSSKLILNELTKIKKNNVYYVKKIEKIPNYLEKIVEKNDMIIFMGAGNINKSIIPFIKRIQ